MIFWRSKERPETRGESFPCKAFRWIVEGSVGTDGAHLGIYHQHQWKSGEWGTSHTSLYEVVVNRSWCWGEQHIYYDGPHCSFSIGPIHFNWGGGIRTGWCKKCMPDDGTPCAEGTCKHRYHQA